MNDEQLERIVAICMGLETAISHLATILESKGVASKSEIAQSFQATAMGIPQNVKAGPIIAVVLNRIAKSIEHSAQQSEESATEMRKLLH